MKISKINFTKNLIKITLLLLITLTITSCTLANENSNSGISKEKFIGVFISTKSLHDKFNEDGNFFANEDILSLDPNELYHYRFTEKDEQGIDGKSIEGAYYFIASNEAIAESEDKVYNNKFTNEITEKHYKNDKGNYCVECTVHINNAKKGDMIVYPYRVYQNNTGKVYLKNNTDSINFSNKDMENGFELGAFSYKEEYASDAFGKKNKQGLDIRVNFVYEIPTKKIKVLEMNDKDELIGKNEYEASNQIIKPKNDVEYLIIEEEKVNKNKKSVFKRSIVNKNSKHAYFYTSENSILCEKSVLFIEWK